MRLTRALYRLCLLALPRGLRRDHAREMTDIFLDRLGAARAEGRRRVPAVWARALLDIAATARESRRRPATDPWLPLHGVPMTRSTPGSLARALWQDTRFAVRLLGRDRAFTATALLTLAICIAANAIIFAVVDAVVLRPLPVPDPDRLVYLYNSYPKGGAPRSSSGVPDYFDRREAMPALESLAIYRRQGLTMTREGGASRVLSIRATPTLVPMLGARAALGRLFTEADGEPGRDRVAVLTHGFWQREFGGDADVVGRSVRLSGMPYEVVGVLAPDFTFIWNDIDLWIPAAFSPDQRADNARHSNNWQMVGRLAPGATIDQAQQQVDAVNARNDERFPAFREILRNAGFRTIAVGLQDDLVREVRPTLYLLWGGVLLVLLLGAVNIANLVLVRATRRTRELATRQAVGADRGRLRMQLLTESLLLSVAGGVLGLALARIGLGPALVALRVADLPRGYEVTLGAWPIAVVLGVSVVVGLVIGLIPAARATKLDVTGALRDESRSGTAGRGTLFVRRALATAQLALAFVLLVGAGLLLSSFRAVLQLDPGFRAEGVKVAAIGLPGASYGTPASIVSFQTRLVEAARAIPGVEAAGLIDVLPMSGDSSDSVLIPEGNNPRPGESIVSPWIARASDDYFRSMGIELVQGRHFDARDRADTPRVTVIDEQLAARFWPGQDPIGRRVYRPNNPEAALAPPPNVEWITVVGVVRNVRVTGFDTSATPIGAYYFPMAQDPSPGFAITLRTSGDPETLATPLRQAVQALDPELPLFAVNTMTTLLDDALAGRRVPMRLSVLFGGVALLLAAVGVYGVLAYAVAERRREIGIRMALGSTTADIFRTILGDGLKLVAAGLAIGAVGAYFAGRTMTSLLYAVEPTDVRVGLSVAALLAAVAMLATLLPARRATKVSPATALQG